MNRIAMIMALAIGALLPVAASHAVPNRVTAGMVGEWHMSPTSSFPYGYKRVLDTSGYNRHGRIYGGEVGSYGWMDQGANMVGDKYVQVPNSTNLNIGTGSFTLAAWVRITGTANNGFPIKTIISNEGSDSRGYSFMIGYGDRLLLNLSDTANHTWTHSSEVTSMITLNRWHHVAVSVNRTSWPVNIAFYVDGYNIGNASPAVMGNIVNTDQPFYIGGSQYPTIATFSNFNDRIDEVFAYNRALPNWEVWNVLNPGQPAYTPSYWNIGGDRQYNNNCYNYANNKATNTRAQPGRASIGMATSMTCPAVRIAAIGDGLEPISDYPSWPLDFKKGVALVTGHVDGTPDYHWYRLDSNGTWSHKPGGGAARNTDESGNIITDPRTANRAGYINFCGFFLVWTDTAEGYGHENVN